MSRVVWLVALIFALAGCGGEESGREPSEAAEGGAAETSGLPEEAAVVPAYEVVGEEPCPVDDQRARCLSLASEADSADEFRSIIERLREENPGTNALVVTFYPNEQPAANSSGAGYAFSDENVARAMLSAVYPDGVDVEEFVDRAMENDGIYVIAVADRIGGTTEERTGS